MRLVEPLEVEDWVVQSMPDASPVKWHLAHTTWFFERFVLRPLGVAPVAEIYDYLFNSYYESVGSRHPRARRGMLTRPTAAEVVAYRVAVDARIADLEGSRVLENVAEALELGKNHEEQHQELLLTDVKHLFSESPLAPVYCAETAPNAPPSVNGGAPIEAVTTKRAPKRVVPSNEPVTWTRFEGGIVSVGHEGDSFAFDNERPRHRELIAPFELARRLVTCSEYLAFIDDGGYRRPELWLAEGWAWVNAGDRRAPMYWDLDARTAFTLRGTRPLSANEPVCHVTYYEADAYARWSSARLPLEAEWEVGSAHVNRESEADAASGATNGAPLHGALLEDAAFHPRAARPGLRIAQVFGDTWEWTASAYAPYPGFTPLPGAFGEYNGKFMVSQMVLRGGSCATPREHLRSTYRNFFPPNAAWQFTGIRLARDAT